MVGVKWGGSAELACKELFIVCSRIWVDDGWGRVRRIDRDVGGSNVWLVRRNGRWLEARGDGGAHYTMTCQLPYKIKDDVPLASGNLDVRDLLLLIVNQLALEKS